MLLLPIELSPQVVKPILDTIICPTRDYFGHFCPLGSAGGEEAVDGGIFNGIPVGEFEAGVEVVYVAFPTLLAGTMRGHALGDDAPLERRFHFKDHV